MWILFEGGFYSGADTIIFTHVVTLALAPSDGAQTERGDLYRFLNTRRSFATSIREPASSFLASFSLGASTTWSQLFEWAGADTI